MKTKTTFPIDNVKAFREKIGKNIRSLREAQGLSQDELADIMQVHRSTISKVETGKFAITIDYLVKFAWYLDFEIILQGEDVKQ
jgi:transcriptional regulator with XRE-family HTH domain